MHGDGHVPAYSEDMTQMKSMTEIEKQIYVHYKMLSVEDRLYDETPLNTPSLKRKLDELHTINFASPCATSLHDLVCAFANTGVRWLEIERASFPLDVLRTLKPSLTVMVDENQARLMQHSLTHVLYQRVDTNQLSCTTLFKCTDLAMAVPIEADHKFDLLTTIGSLNRFFKTEENARQLFKNMASYLVPGGHLVCVFRSGDHLLPPPSPLSKKNKKPQHLSVYSPLKEILGAPFGLLAPTTQSVTHDTPLSEILNAYCVQSHHQDATTEYLVFCDAVLRLAQDNGLTPVCEYPQQIKKYFSPTSNNTATPFKRFVDTCYIAMVFKKTQ